MDEVTIEIDCSESAAKFRCQNCEGIRNCTVLSKVKKSVDVWYDDDIDDDGNPFYTTSYEELLIAKCNGCDSLFFVKKNSFSEDMDHMGRIIEFQKIYPEEIKEVRIKRNITITNEEGNEDQYIEKLYNEILLSLNNSCYAVASMGIRTLLDRVAVCLSQNDEGSFSKNLEALQKKELISREQLNTLEAALEPGHGATHRGFMPTANIVNNAMDIVETFFELLVPHKAAARSIKNAVPRYHKTKTAERSVTPPPQSSRPNPPDGGDDAS